MENKSPCFAVHDLRYFAIKTLLLLPNENKLGFKPGQFELNQNSEKNISNYEKLLKSLRSQKQNIGRISSQIMLNQILKQMQRNSIFYNPSVQNLLPIFNNINAKAEIFKLKDIDITEDLLKFVIDNNPKIICFSRCAIQNI
ncbi:MAG: hypothetical protein MHPSP_000650, partial [Paramarteilia canceri]